MAETVTEVEAATALVETVNVELVLPPGIVTFNGTTAADLLLFNDTITPPLGAFPLKVTVPWEVLPPTTLDRLRVSELKIGGVTVKVEVFVSPP